MGMVGPDGGQLPVSGCLICQPGSSKDDIRMGIGFPDEGDQDVRSALICDDDDALGLTPGNICQEFLACVNLLVIRLQI